MEEIFGYVERITFQSQENGFTVARLKEPRKQDLTTIVGYMPSIQPGETLRCKGQWKHDPRHGLQFTVQESQTEAPADVSGIQKYLESGMIKGIGAVYAERIVDCFGEKTLEIMDKSPERLLEVQGIGKRRLETITKCWDEQRAVRDVMVFLQGHGVSPIFAQKIFRRYGEKAIEKLQENPYCLARDIHGVGFKSADRIAEKLGIGKESPQRVDAGVEYILNELSSDGHTCFPLEKFREVAGEMLEVSQDLIQGRLGYLEGDQRICLETLPLEGQACTFIWLKVLYLCELGIAREVNRLRTAECALRDIEQKQAIEWVQKKLGLELAKNQKEAVARSFSDKFHIITGGPGTGKSTITNAILRVVEQLSSKIILAAPTGRAAKRMSEITGKKASTIHSLLEFDFREGRFKKNREQPLECDLIIVDEASMIDTALMYSLLKAIPDGARVVLVGDINQLPSVGPGNVLRDMIASERIPVTTLNEIFRQAASSFIITNAHRINEGQFPVLFGNRDRDFFFLEAPEPRQVADSILSVVSHRLPKKYGFDPIDDIQVLAPMKRGEIGTENLNLLLQKALNPRGEPFVRGGKSFKIGDKVMQIRNNYQKEVFNGDVGRIREIDQAEQMMVVDVDGQPIEYAFSDLDELVLAYAVSIHKYQGSECRCVVMPVHTSHFMMLTRNLLYTGITRAKELVVLVGTKKAVFIAVNNNQVQQRYNGLQQALLAMKTERMFDLSLPMDKSRGF